SAGQSHPTHPLLVRARPRHATTREIGLEGPPILPGPVPRGQDGFGPAVSGRRVPPPAPCERSRRWHQQTTEVYPGRMIGTIANRGGKAAPRRMAMAAVVAAVPLALP